MTTGDMIMEVHKALIAKMKERCAIDGSKLEILRSTEKFGEYVGLIRDSFSDDGKLDGKEEAAINAKMQEIVDAYIPKVSGFGVSIAWNGLSFIGWKGIRSYIAKWFKLDLR